MEILDLAEHFDPALLQAAYEQVYQPAFPIREEQESPEQWAPRLAAAGGDAPQLTLLVAGEGLRSSRPKPLGLVLAEFYPASGCVLVSYLAVAAHARGEGVGRALVQALSERLASGAASRGRPVHAVLAEMHDPAQAAPSGDVMPPLQREQVLTRLGARRLPVDYVQPPLSAGGRPAHGLCLLAFPSLLPGRPPPRADRVHRFLLEFYAVLGVADPQQDPLYRATFESVRRWADAETRSAPARPVDRRAVRSALQLRHVAIAFQFEGVVRSEGWSDLPTCPHFGSCERDLTAHAFLHQPLPVRSVCVPALEPATAASGGYSVPCVLSFPQELAFSTEGQDMLLERSGVGSVPASLSLSVSRFASSGRFIVHLVLHLAQPAGQATFGEYEILSLAKGWCKADLDSEQGYEPLRPLSADRGTAQPTLRPATGGDPEDVLTFARRHFPLDELVPAASAPIGGCVQVIGGGDAETGPDPAEADASDTGALGRLVRPLAPGVPLGRAYRALAGLIQNILDLDNVDESEARDMLEGLNVTEQSVTTVHRGTLLSVTTADRLFEDKGDSIGISPYLLLPHGAVLHNELVLRQAQQATEVVDEAQQRLAVAHLQGTPVATARPPDETGMARARGGLMAALDRESKGLLEDLPGSVDGISVRVVRWLWRRASSARPGPRRAIERKFVAELDLALFHGVVEHARSGLRRLLDRELVPDIFQYPSERWIFRAGQQDHGTAELLSALRSRQVELDGLAASETERQREWFNSNLTMIGLVLTLFQVLPMKDVVEHLLAGRASAGVVLLFVILLDAAIAIALLRSRILAFAYMRTLAHASRRLAERLGTARLPAFFRTGQLD